MSFEVSWRKVRGELPGWCAGDAGMVPLSARETAKGEEQATQLARSPDHAHQPGSSPLGNARRKKRHKKVGKIIKKYLQGKLTYDIVKKLILCTSADSASGA